VLVIDRCPSQPWIARVSCPLLARAYSHGRCRPPTRELLIVARATSLITASRNALIRPHMATPTSRGAPAADVLIEERDALCAELIALEREGQPRVTRAAAIEARLKQIAGERGESFKVMLSNGDYVQVSPPVQDPGGVHRDDTKKPRRRPDSAVMGLSDRTTLTEMSPTSIAPTCPHCVAPLRLIRVLPRVPPDAPVETRTFKCSSCQKTVTRTVRLDDDRA
jgi:hypothetical protein